eukprot:6289412-Pyramimonas_sp.AAC.1
MIDTSAKDFRVGTRHDVQSAAVAATSGQIEHTHEVRRCFKRWPVNMKDDIERYSRQNRDASAKHGNMYANMVREDLEKKGGRSPSSCF